MTLKIGMIGTGLSGEKLLAPALRAADGAMLWSILSRDKNRATAFASSQAAASPSPAFDSLDEMLSDRELDAVFIASPDKLHAPQTIAAARAGQHILLEKPMATDRADGRAMIEACRDAGVTLAIAYHLRWHRGHRALHSLAQDGQFGTLRHMRVLWPTPQHTADGWRSKTDIGRWWSLAAVGTHCLGPGALVHAADLRWRRAGGKSNRKRGIWNAAR